MRREPLAMQHRTWGTTRSRAFGAHALRASMHMLLIRLATPEAAAISVACTSIGSPSGVPDPCASISCGRTPAKFQAPSSSITCESRFGDVKLALCPAHLAVLPRMRAVAVADVAAPFRCRAPMMTAAQPSDATKPDARWSKE
eukprot:2735594-Prymnesium_polylepis.1